MTQDEVVALSDVINYLGNTTPATAAQISNVVTRIGPLGEVAAIAPLLSNLGFLEEQFYKVSSAGQYAGSMEAEYAARAATSENTVQIMKNSLKELSDTFGSVFVPSAQNGAQALTEVIYKVTDFVKENGETIKTVTAVVAALLAAKAAYLGIKTVVLSVMGVYKGIRVAMAAYELVQKSSTVIEAANTAAKAANTAAAVTATGATAAATAGTGAFAAASGVAATSAWAFAGALLAVAWPVLAIVAAVAAVIAIVVLLVKHWDKVKAAAATVWEAVKSVFSKIGEFFGGIFDKIKAPFITAINWVKENWKQIVLFIINPFAGIFSYLYKHCEGFRNFINGVVEKVKAIFAGIAEWFSSKVIQPIINIVAPIVQKFGEIFAKIWEIITVLFGVLASWFKDNVITPIVEFFTGLIQTAQGIFQNIWNAITAIFAAVGGWFSDKFTAAWDAVKTAFTPIGEFFAAAWNIVTSVFSNVVGWFSEKFTAAWDAIKAVFSTVGAFFKGVWDNIVAIFTSIGTAVGNAIGDAFKFVVNSIIGFTEGLINKFIGGINGAIGLINKIPGVNIELLTLLSVPRLEKGSNYTPDTFIAGDVGGKGGELITNARGRKVFTAAQTGEILRNVNTINNMVSMRKPENTNIAASMSDLFRSLQSTLSARKIESFNEPPVSVSNSHSDTPITVNYNVTLQVDGNAPNDLDEKLRKSHENLITMIEERLRQRADNERRMAFS